MENSEQARPEQPEVGTLRERLLAELDSVVTDLVAEDDMEDYAVAARTTRDIATALDAVDRVQARQPQLLPLPAIDLPTEVDLRAALWHACEDAGTDTQMADTIIDGALERLGYGGNGEKVG